MKPIGTKTLETERLILRKIRRGDAPAMFKNWAGDAEVTRYLMWNAHADVCETYAIIDRWLETLDDGKQFHWAIELKEIGEIIGTINTVDVNEKNDAAGIGYCIGRRFWGKGIMTEALGAVLDYLFDEADFNRISICHFTDNPASGAVMRKCGLQYEGTRRQCMRKNNGELGDVAYYAMLKRDRRPK